MIDCDKLIERKDLRKEVKRKEGVREKRQEGKRKKKQWCEPFFIACPSFE